MKKEALYNDLAKYYDLIYSKKDYGKESRVLIDLILRHKKSKGKNLLEVGCGTGHHLDYLKKNFSCFGVDINEGILKVARRKHKDIDFEKADMINMRLGKKFDVVVSMFSSIGYVKTLSNLRKTLRNFSNHLEKGGVVVIEPWFSPDNYFAGAPHLTTYEDENIKIARVNVSRRRGDVSILDFNYLIAERGKKVKYFQDSHELGLFGIDETLRIMRDVGLNAKFLKDGFSKGRGVFVGVRV